MADPLGDQDGGVDVALAGGGGGGELGGLGEEGGDGGDAVGAEEGEGEGFFVEEGEFEGGERVVDPGGLLRRHVCEGGGGREEGAVVRGAAVAQVVG